MRLVRRLVQVAIVCNIVEVAGVGVLPLLSRRLSRAHIGQLTPRLDAGPTTLRVATRRVNSRGGLSRRLRRLVVG